MTRGAISSLIAPASDLETLAWSTSLTGWDGLELRVAPPSPDERSGFWGRSAPTIDEDQIGSAAARGVTVVRAAGLDIAAFSTYAPIDDRDRYLPILQAAHDTGVPAVRLQPGHRMTLEERRRLIARAADDAASFGVQILLETHFGTQLASASAVRLAVEGTDPTTVGVILDVGNLLVEGYEDWTTATEILSGYLYSVHAKNVRTGKLHPEGREYSWESAAGGELDLRAVIRQVFATAEPEWLVVEDLSDPNWTIDRSREWHALFTDAGAFSR